MSDISDLSFHFLYLNNDTKRIRGGWIIKISKYLIRFIDVGPVIQDMWMNMNNASRGQAYQKVRMYSAVR